jgi:hypothetical protein
VLRKDSSVIQFFEQFGDRQVLLVTTDMNVGMLVAIIAGSIVGAALIILIISSIVIFIISCMNAKKGKFVQMLDDELSEYRRNLLYDDKIELKDVALDAIRQTETYFIKYTDLEFIDRLGSGAFGVVFKGSYNMTSVAIKMIQFDISDLTETAYKDLSAQFRNEALTMARIHHPKCVLFMGLCINDGYRYIVSELMAQSLADLLSSSDNREETSDLHLRLTFKQKLHILVQVTQAMAYLHSVHMIHYDLKPGNILLDEHCSTAKVRLISSRFNST